MSEKALMEKKRKISKTEIAITLVCLMLIYASYYGLQNIDEYLAMRDMDAKRPVIGTITRAENDTRHRITGSFVWFKAKDDQNIRGGDAVFSGEKSNVQIGLKNGSGVTVGENSLVVFSEFDNMAMPDLQMGNFNFRVNGTASVMIDGQLTTVKGTNSEIQVVLKKGEKPVMKLLKGSAEVETSEQKFTPLAINKIEKVKLKDNSFVPPKNVILTDYKKEDAYIWRLHDIYDIQGIMLTEKNAIPTSVKQPHGVAWSDAFEANTIVELATDVSFNAKERIVSNTGGITFRKLNLGPNYWRVSLDEGKSWSKTELFTVTGQFSEETRPRITKFGENIPLINKSSSIELDVKAPFDTLGYATEASQSPDFAPEKTRSFWSPGRQIKLSFYKPGQYFYRFRTINQDQKLSSWSDVQKFNVYIPKLPGAPELLQLSRRDGYPGETFRFNWDVKGTLTKTAVVNTEGEIVAESVGTTVKFQPKRTGRYKVIARSYNEFGQAGPTSKPFFVRVGPQPNHLLQAMKDEQAKRKLAQEKDGAETSINLNDLLKPDKRNMAYRSSSISARGMVWTLQSSDEYYATGNTSSNALGGAVRGMKWFDRNGLEAIFKTGIVRLSNTEGNQVQSMDVRYHRRFFFALPVKFAPEVQVSAFAGYGVSNNTGSNFANQYDLVKFGTSLEFPVGDKWGTGGEVLYGIAPDASQYEISGHLDYYLSKDWSLGAGYRLYLFEAKKASVAPNGTLPYREGYTEGYSGLNYHF